MKSNKRIGTVGCRLHYGDNTIQHDGMALYLKDNKILITHKNLRHYHNHSINEVETIGNTGGLMMIRQRVFNSIGGFNESYESHLEDVELNLTLLTKGLKNITCSNLVSYHYESQTRGEGIESSEESIRDYKDRLIVFISNNLHKLKKHIISI
jgi:GT2 family glycosyltransferase